MKPILFNTEMVRAILEGRKTATRRVIKPQPSGPLYQMPDSMCWPGCFANAEEEKVYRPPYQPGDILWVRETWCEYIAGHIIAGVRYAYKADATPNSEETRKELGYKWRPSIHMPREAARLFLRVTGVRVERLQDITEEECEAEGIAGWTKDGKLYKYAHANEENDFPCLAWSDCPHTPKSAMQIVWDRTIKPVEIPLCGWEANPWVWVIEFERIRSEEVGSE